MPKVPAQACVKQRTRTPSSGNGRAPADTVGVRGSRAAVSISPSWIEPIAQVLQLLGSEHVLVVHSAEGLDEISIAGPTHVVELHRGKTNAYTIAPEDFGLSRAPLDGLIVADAAQSLDLIRRAYSGEMRAARDMLALNAGAALFVAGVSQDIASGVALADDVMSSGQAWGKLQDFARFTTALTATAE